ncbi:MAG: Amidohydrolase [Syntrophorhabdaceae bacterium PtaU1.Bin034]|nr:MAG: Amidohydrolase [Syntrophorhabdaceae bacterium PtaU1.Bin034]
MKPDMEPNPESRTSGSNQATPIKGSIDVHHHILPYEYLHALARLGITRSIGVTFPAWSLQQDMELMDKLGVQVAVVSFSAPAANVPGTGNARSLARLCNDLVAMMVRVHPDRYGAFATVPPLHDIEGVLWELDYALDTLKLDGVELTSNYGLKYLGDPAFEEVYEALNAKKAVIHVHPTDPPGVQFGIPAAVMDAPFDTTRAAFSLICSGVMERYPDIKFILSHGGGTLPYLSYRLGRMAPSTWKSFKQNAPKGFDEYLGRFYYDTAIVSSNAYPYLVKQAGASHVIAGTDYPFAGSTVPAQCLEAVRTCEEVGEQERKGILKDNALALFSGLGKDRG